LSLCFLWCWDVFINAAIYLCIPLNIRLLLHIVIQLIAPFVLIKHLERLLDKLLHKYFTHYSQNILTVLFSLQPRMHIIQTLINDRIWFTIHYQTILMHKLTITLFVLLDKWGELLLWRNFVLLLLFGLFKPRAISWGNITEKSDNFIIIIIIWIVYKWRFALLSRSIGACLLPKDCLWESLLHSISLTFCNGGLKYYLWFWIDYKLRYLN